MIHLDLLLFIDNNATRVVSLKENFLGKVDSQACKVAVNGEHGLLCLDHFEMVQLSKGKKILVVLNLETPMMDGISFLENLKHKHCFAKNKIAVIALDSVSSPEILEKATQKGILSIVNENDCLEKITNLLTEFYADKDEPKFRIPDKPKNLPLTI